MKLIGLMLTIIALGLFFYWMYDRKDPVTELGPAPATSIGARPPSDVGRNYKGTRDFTVRQVCLADCVSTAHNCSSVTTEPEALEACAKAKSACEARCPSDER